MKILSVYSSIPRDVAEWVRVSNMANILRDNGHEVKFVHYCRKSAYLELENKEDFLDHEFIITSPLGVHLKHFNYLRKEKYDLVYGNNYMATFFSLLGKLTKVPLIYDMHGDPVQEFLVENKFSLNPSFLARYLQFNIMHYSDLHCANEVLCVSHKAMDFMHEKKGISRKKLNYVTNGVDLDFFRPMENSKVLDLKNDLNLNDKLVFGYVGGFHKLQGIPNLINAAEKIEDDSNAFLIVGGISKSKKENITFIPRVSKPEIPYYYSVCNVLVLPRPSHPGTDMAAPTKFAEYTAMGKPVLTSDVGDAAYLVKKYKCGIVVDSNSPEDLKEGINKFNSLGLEKLTKMGKNARKLAEKEFDWEKVGKNLLKVIERYK